MEKTITDFKDLLNERESKFKKLYQKDISYKREEDEIVEDFLNDPRRKAYHDLRRESKGNKHEEEIFMKTQNEIFNQ
jgi:hypothetical protein